MSLVVPDFYPPSLNPVPIRPIPENIRLNDVLPPDLPQNLLKALPEAIVRAIPEVVNRVLPKKETWFRDELEMRSVKILDMGYIAVLYFTFAIITSYFIDKFLGEFKLECEQSKSTFRIGVELLVMIWFLGVITYITRKLVEMIPSPMPNIPLSNPDRKFDHGRMRELSSASVFTLILMGTSYHFRQKLEYFYKRVTQRVLRVKN